jgi:hypothetical protein
MIEREPGFAERLGELIELGKSDPVILRSLIRRQISSSFLISLNWKRRTENRFYVPLLLVRLGSFGPDRRIDLGFLSS